MLTAPPLPPPAIAQPAAYELSYGDVVGRAAPGTTRVIVRVAGRTAADLPLRQRRFQLRVDLPAHETSVRVITVNGAGRRSAATVPHVFGVPRVAAPRWRTPVNDALLEREVRRLATSFSGTAGIYVENLGTGAGAAWNAKATFPAASALKLAIAVTALARTEGTPVRGSGLDVLMRQMLIVSDNGAANGVERWFAGSTHAGSAAVNATMRSLGLYDTEMYGGYELEALGTPPRALASAIPLRVTSQPYWGRGKKTSAFDLARLARAVWLASGGLGPLHTVQPGFTPTDARYLLYLLAHVRDPGKVDREIHRIPGVAVLHKAGWIARARHDNAIVVWPGGVYVVAVMTYRPWGAGVSSDVLAGRVAAAALGRFRDRPG